MSRALDIAAVETFGGPFAAIAVDGTQVFAVHGRWLESYDGRDPARLLLEGRTPLDRRAERATRAVLSAGSQRVAVRVVNRGVDPPRAAWQIFETRQGAPPLAGGMVGVSGEPFEAAIQDGHLYAATREAVYIIDVRDAARPHIVYTFPMRLMSTMRADQSCGTVSAMIVRDTRLFVAAQCWDRLSATSRVSVFDVRDPVNPVRLAFQDFTGQIDALSEFRGRLLAWRQAGPAGLSTSEHMVEILTADPPTLLSQGQIHLGAAFYLERVTIVDEHALVFGYTSTDGFKTVKEVIPFDLGALPQAITRGSSYRETVGWTVDVMGDALLVANGWAGLDTFGIDAATGGIVRRGHIATLGEARGLATDGRHVYTADDDGEIWVLDVTPSGEVAEVAHAPLTLPDGRDPGPSSGASLTVAGDRLYVARGGTRDNEGGDVVEVSIADPMRPRALNVWKPADDPMILSASDSGVGAFGPFVAAGHVYATLSAGLIDLDGERLSDRARRLFRDPDCGHGTVGKDGVSGCRGAGAAVDGDRAFVARAWAGVQVFDLSMAGASTPIDALPAFDARDVAVSGRIVYVADGAHGLRAYDRDSKRAGDLSGLFGAHRISLAAETAFVVGPAIDPEYRWQVGSVWAVDVTDPFVPVLRGHVVLPRDYTTGIDWNVPPHVLVISDVLLATVPGGGVATYMLADGRTLPAQRRYLPCVIASR